MINYILLFYSWNLQIQLSSSIMEHHQHRAKLNLVKVNKENMKRQSISINKGCRQHLNAIVELSNEHIPNANTNLDLQTRVDAKTLNLIKTYKNLDLPCLQTMNEQQSVIRYLNDPFFRKKMEYEYEYLTKLKSKTRLAIVTKQIEEQQPKGRELVGSKRKIRFKQIMIDDAKHTIEQAEKYENLLRKVSLQEVLKIPSKL